jgi:hypothetical protein
MAYDPVRVKETLARWRRVLRHLNDIVDDYDVTPLRHSKGERERDHGRVLKELYARARAADDIIRERDLYYLERLRWRALAHVEGCEAIRPPLPTASSRCWACPPP